MVGWVGLWVGGFCAWAAGAAAAAQPAFDASLARPDLQSNPLLPQQTTDRQVGNKPPPPPSPSTHLSDDWVQLQKVRGIAMLGAICKGCVVAALSACRPSGSCSSKEEEQEQPVTATANHQDGVTVKPTQPEQSTAGGGACSTSNVTQTPQQLRHLLLLMGVSETAGVQPPLVKLLACNPPS